MGVIPCRLSQETRWGASAGYCSFFQGNSSNVEGGAISKVAVEARLEVAPVSGGIYDLHLRSRKDGQRDAGL
jgi:hypothetical protein